MRYFLLLAALWLLFGVAVAAPLPTDTAVLSINRLPADGLLLAKGWRYHAGDNPTWARPDFDDRGWDTLNPARPRRELPPAVSTGIGWLRLRFTVGDSLRQRALLLVPSYLGAVEIYVNGKLLRRDGVLSPVPTNVQATSTRLEPLELPANFGSEGVLAVRFAPYQARWQRGMENLRFFAINLRTERQVRQQQTEHLAALVVYYATAIAFLLLALLHLAFYGYNPAQRANRYFARYTLVLALASLALYYIETLLSPTHGGWAEWTVPAWYALMVVSALYAVRALYELFGQRPGRLYAGLWLSSIGFLGVEVFWRYSPLSFFAFLGFMLVVTAEQLRLTGRALRQRQRGARIIASGFAITLFWLLITVGLTMLDATSLVVNYLAFALVVLPPALGISLYLAREFALDSQLLQVKLGEVERLSAQTLAQEQDKQALLESQNETLETQVHERTGELQRSLTDLRATQQQLIQKEKMASLGELTAGIAHEIQNPLNFVNNFAEVSAELLDELEEEQAKPDRDMGLEAELVGDLRQNLGKISHHGRRAAAIVKGMLEHSRTSTGERAPTDLNQLAEEYLRLAYQGLRAKDKSFNATLATDFAAGLPLVEAAGADVGRVLLNLFGNAFYAVQQRQQTGEAGYRPTVSVSTQIADNKIVIRVRDNGAGIPDEVKVKIFQPFFTTKPTGEGTGLGLSLSHDIITQGHGGTLAVESQPGQSTTFIVSIPA